MKNNNKNYGTNPSQGRGGGQKLLSVANSPESEVSKSSAEIAKFGAKCQFIASYLGFHSSANR